MAGISKRDMKWFEMFIIMSSIAKSAGNELSKLICDYNDTELKLTEIKELEHKGDKIVHRMYDELGKAFMTPIDREYISIIICKMDDIIDRIDRTAQMFDVYGIEKMTPEAIELSHIITSCLDTLNNATIECDILPPPTLMFRGGGFL